MALNSIQDITYIQTTSVSFHHYTVDTVFFQHDELSMRQLVWDVYFGRSAEYMTQSVI